jgi:hypothetical protein
VWRDALLLDHPIEHRHYAIGGVTDKALRPEAEAICNSLDHRLGRCHLLGAQGWGGFDVDDDAGAQVDQVVG